MMPASSGHIVLKMWKGGQLAQYNTVELTVLLIQKTTKHLTFPLSYTITGGGEPYHCTTDTDLSTRRERRGSEREREREREREGGTEREGKLFNPSKPPVIEAKNKNLVPI